MKILQISTNYYSTKVYNNLFTALAKKMDIKVFVPLTTDKKQQYGDIIIPENVTSVFFGKSQAFGYQINAPKYAKYIISNKIHEGIDLVHAHFVFSDGAIALQLFKRIGIPYVVAVRTSCINGFSRKIALHNIVTGLNVLKNAQIIAFQTPVAQKKLLEKLPKIYRRAISKKCIVIPNGIENFWHSNIYEHRKNINKKKFTILTAASIEYNKNLLNIAKVVVSLNKKGFNIEYQIAGAIKDKSILDELNKNSNTKYLGSLNREELLKAYRQSDIFVMVSYNETFGLVYVEAMSQGLPVIYTTGEGFDGQFDEGVVGYHASSNSLEEIEEAILKVVSKYKILSENATININKFNWEKIADKYCALYLEVQK